MTNTQQHAINEFAILEKNVPDASVIPFKKEILALCEAFGKSGQSGGSAPYTAGAITSAIKSLLSFDLLYPITGDDSEWSNSIDEETYQNIRLSSLFKTKTDKPYYLEAIIWQGEEDFDTFTGRVYLDEDATELISSKQNVRFPFTPKSFYIDVRRIPIEKEVAEKRNLHYIEGHNECYYSVIKNPEQLKEVWEYYDKK